MRTRTTIDQPILASWKVSDVLQKYPALLEVFVAVSPTFRLLRNPVMRRVQSRLVTVGQAAQIAGMEPAVLVRRLNEAIGVGFSDDPGETSAADARDRAEPPVWVETAVVAAELDAREMHRQGEEPFSAIMAAVRRVPVGHVFLLRNTFEPLPLYDVLGARGFEHWTRQLGPDDWEVLFFNAGKPRPGKEPARGAGTSVSEPADAALDWTSPDATVTIDVSELVPPEPLIRILETLESLPDGATLLVHHVRRPMHLYPRLDELGYRHETRDLGPGKVEVLIEKTVPRREARA